jgi:uncharacterized protein (TIGR03435 family)
MLFTTEGAMAACRVRFCFVGIVAFGMSAVSGGAQTVQAAGKPLAFDVISIRPSRPGTGGAFIWQTSADGYSVKGQSLQSTIQIAYIGRGNTYWPHGRLAGAPVWVDVFYDIEAKVAPADLAAWQKQGLTLDQKDMLRAMLRTALEERCKLVVHLAPAEVEGYALVVSKRGSKLNETKAGGVPAPTGMAFPDGGAMVWSGGKGEAPRQSYFDASMSSLAMMLSISSQHPVLDQTGLVGKYDFVLTRRDGEAEADLDASSIWDLGAIGLELRPVKVPTETVVVDHIERPSEN